MPAGKDRISIDCRAGIGRSRRASAGSGDRRPNCAAGEFTVGGHPPFNSIKSRHSGETVLDRRNRLIVRYWSALHSQRRSEAN